MKSQSPNRRQFLKLASTLLAVPFSSLSNVGANAQAGKAPLRMLTVIDTYGLPLDKRNSIWLPSTASDYKFTSNNQLGTILSELSDYKENMLVPTGINLDIYSGLSHSVSAMTCLTGSLSNGVASSALAKTYHESIDVFVGDYLSNDYGLPSGRQHEHLFFTSYAQNADTTFCYNKNGNQIRSIKGANAIQSSILAGATQNTGSVDFQSELDQSILSLVQAQIQSIRGELVNVNSATMMDAYKTSVEDLADQLALASAGNQGPTECPSISFPTLATNVATTAQVPNIFKAIGNIFACDLASSVTYAIGGEMTNQHRHSFLYDEDEHNDATLKKDLGASYHAISHKTNDVGDKGMELVRKYQAKELSVLLDSLKATPDIGGDSVFDNTVVFVTSPQAGTVHKTSEYPHLLIAGKNTGLRGGYHYDCSGRTLNDLLVTIANSVGANIDEFGGFERNGNRTNSLNNGPISKMLL